MGIVLDNNTTAISAPSGNTMSPKLVIDEDILTEACSSQNIVKLEYIGSDNSMLPLHKSTSTPEGQLYDLRVVHAVMNDRF
jgi:hypothetical protein